MQVLNWVPTLLQRNTYKPTIVPVITFVPNLNVLQYIRENGYRVTIKLLNTETVVDGLPINGTVAKATEIFGTTIPNFEVTPPVYAISLEYPWFGYPLSLENAKLIIL